MAEPSSSTAKHFDVLLGGEETVPTSIVINQFLTARINEIDALSSVIDNTTKFASRKDFPRHLRRRAMSHNIKRIPRRIRGLHESIREKSNTKEGPNKVPRRKWRRRPGELLKEYNRRQKEFIWLETHIWHARRFHMTEKWGYKLPYRPCDKNYRACYRASAEHCLLQDFSYLNCIELRGDFHCIIEGLKCHTSDRTGTTFDSRLVCEGRRSGRTMFYHGNKFPRGAVGEVDFLWDPSTDKDRIVWIWAHPAYVAEIVYDLVTTFGLAKEEEMETEAPLEGVEMEKLGKRNVPFCRTPKYSNGGLNMSILKDTLNRFRLTGPLSQAVIAKILQPANFKKRSVQDWASEYYSEETGRLPVYANQVKFWKKLKNFTSPAQLPPNCIMPLTIYDPRFVMPKSRTKATFNEEGQDLIQSPLQGTDLVSPIWSSEIRDQTTFNKLSTHQLNEMRSEKLVPGLDVEKAEGADLNFPVLPVLLLQRPGGQQMGKRLGYNSGWDIICPAGYGMPMWLALVMSGARAAGLREIELLERESWVIGPFVPDSEAGLREENVKKNQLMDEHFRLPPAKRHNYTELGIPSPFKCQWDLLVRDWSEQDEFYVLRNKFVLRSLQNSLDNRVKVCRIDPPGALLAVSITFPSHKGKGLLTPFSHICIPQKGDSELQGKPYSNQRPIVEPKHPDVNRTKRKELHTLHQSLLKRLARKRKKVRDAKKISLTLYDGSDSHSDTPRGHDTDPDNGSKEIVEEHANLLRELWLPSNSSIKNHCLRMTLGFVTNGDYSFTESMSCGVGYVSLDGLLYYLSTVPVGNEVLVRCTNSSQYRLARINIIL